MPRPTSGPIRRAFARQTVAWAAALAGAAGDTWWISSVDRRRRVMVGRTGRDGVLTHEGLTIHGDTLLVVPEDEPCRVFTLCATHRPLSDRSRAGWPCVRRRGCCSTSPAASLLPIGRHRPFGAGQVAAADTSPRTRPWQLPFNPPRSR